MDKFVSADSPRRALLQLEQTAAFAWLDLHLIMTNKPVLTKTWTLDLDATVKRLQGKYLEQCWLT